MRQGLTDAVDLVIMTGHSDKRSKDSSSAIPSADAPLEVITGHALADQYPSRRIRRSHTPRDLGTALTLDDSNVVLALQVKPELGTISKISAEPDGRIRGDRPASIQYVCDATRWHAEMSASRFALSSPRQVHVRWP